MQTSIDFGKGHIPWLKIPAPNNSTIAENIHLSPANGIPAASYQSMLECFSDQYNISGMDCRGGWPNEPLPPKHFTWSDHADDLITAIESQYSSPIIGMGHSLGATVTLLAAQKRPDLFSKLVLIDAASLPNQLFCYFYGSIPKWLSFRLFKFIKRTHNRQRIWVSREAFYENYKNHSTYRSFTEQSLRDYADYGLRKRSDGQYELIFNPAWESFNFRKVHYLWQALKSISHPTLLLRAEHTYLYTQEQFDRRNQSLGENITAQTIPNCNHLVTHESPDKLSKQIRNWLDK